MPPRAPPKERALSTSVSAKEATHASAKTHHQVADTAIGVGPHQGETGTSVQTGTSVPSPMGSTTKTGVTPTYAAATARSGELNELSISSPFAAMIQATTTSNQQMEEGALILAWAMGNMLTSQQSSYNFTSTLRAAGSSQLIWDSYQKSTEASIKLAFKHCNTNPPSGEQTSAMVSRVLHNLSTQDFMGEAVAIMVSDVRFLYYVLINR